MRNHQIYTMLYKKTGPFVISSYLCFDSYELHENFQKYLDVTYGIAIPGSWDCCVRIYL